MRIKLEVGFVHSQYPSTFVVEGSSDKFREIKDYIAKGVGFVEFDGENGTVSLSLSQIQWIKWTELSESVKPPVAPKKLEPINLTDVLGLVLKEIDRCDNAIKMKLITKVPEKHLKEYLESARDCIAVLRSNHSANPQQYYNENAQRTLRIIHAYIEEQFIGQELWSEPNLNREGCDRILATIQLLTDLARQRKTLRPIPG